MTAPPSRQMLEALKKTADGMIAASDGMIAANKGLKKIADAALLARDEHDDLRDTVQRLEGLVMELIQRQRDRAGTPHAD